MCRDIDQVIERLKAELPGCQVSQLKVSHPGADDDGLWFVTIPALDGTVNVESSSGACPFLIESDFNTERHQSLSEDDAVATVKRLLLLPTACAETS